jgi:hypothetical protein
MIFCIPSNRLLAKDSLHKVRLVSLDRRPGQDVDALILFFLGFLLADRSGLNAALGSKFSGCLSLSTIDPKERERIVSRQLSTKENDRKA